VSNRCLVRILSALSLGVFLAPSASGELAAWDQGRVIALAKDLAAATEALYETFTQQPQPEPGSMQSRSYHGLEHRVGMLRVEARVLVKSLAEGDGREQTVWLYHNLMSNGRSARYEARDAFVAEEVGERAAAVRAALNRLGPYYDPDFETLAPDPNIEPGAAR
jgi:hypothetical protein